MRATPSVVIYSDLNDEKLFLHLRGWGLPMPLSQTIAWDWETTQEQLQTNGMSEKQSLKQIRQEIVNAHQLLAAFLADVYYLSVNPLHEPRLFQLPQMVGTKELADCFATLRQLQEQRRADYEEELRLLAAQEACELGVKYSKQGNYKEAFSWFRKAAEQGNAVAQYHLGEMYEAGLWYTE